jgi:hypothetical protein
MEESIGQTQVIEDLEGGWMDRVPAKVAEEVSVLFEHHDRNAGASEQQAQHRAGRTTTGNTTPRFDHTVVDSGSKGITSVQAAYSRTASGPVASRATTQPSLTMVGSTSK